MSKKDEAFQNYHDLVNEKQKNDHLIKNAERKIEEIKQAQMHTEEIVRAKNDEQISALKAQIKEKKSVMFEKKNHLLTIPEAFDVDMAYKEYTEETDVLGKNMMIDLRKKCDEAKQTLQKKDEEINKEAQIQIQLVEKDETASQKFKHVTYERQNGTIPVQLKKCLETPDDDKYIKECGIVDGHSIIQIGQKVPYSFSISNYVYGWDTVVFVILMLLAAALCSVLLFGHGGIGNSVARLTIWLANGASSLFQKIFWAIVSMLVISLAGGIIGCILGAVTAIEEDFSMKIAGVGAAIGAVIGLVLGFQKAEVSSIAIQTQETIGTIGRIVVLILILIAVFFIILNTDFSTIVLELVLQIPFLNNIAQEKSKESIDRDISYCYVLLRYREILFRKCANNLFPDRDELIAQLGEWEKQQDTALEKFQSQREAEWKNAMELKKKEFEEQKKQMLSQNEQISNTIKKMDDEISDINGKIKYKEENLEKAIKDEMSTYRSQIHEYQTDINSKKAENKRLITRIDLAVEDFEKIKIPDIEETHGRMSDVVYLKLPGNHLDYPDIQMLEHDQQPMLFLYSADKDTRDDNKVDLVYKIINEILWAFVYNNSIEVLGLNIVDNYKSAIDLKSESGFEIYNEKNINELYSKVDRVINNVATYNGGKTWNDVIVAEEQNSGILDPYMCQVTAILFPPQTLAKTQFDEELWQLVRKGKQKGFIPLFFVCADDYDKYDSEKDHGTAMEKINQVFEEKNHIYRIDLTTNTVVGKQ